MKYPLCCVAVGLVIGATSRLMPEPQSTIYFLSANAAFCAVSFWLIVCRGARD